MRHLILRLDGILTVKQTSDKQTSKHANKELCFTYKERSDNFTCPPVLWFL